MPPLSMSRWSKKYPLVDCSLTSLCLTCEFVDGFHRGEGGA